MVLINRWSDSIEYPENNPIYIGDSSEEIWATKDEVRIRVGDMTDAHVLNSYKMVMNTLDTYWRSVFKAELDKRGIEV